MKSTFVKGNSVAVSVLLLIIFLAGACKKNGATPTAAAAAPNLALVADNLLSPLSVVEAPDDSKRLFIVDEGGKIFIVPPHASILATPFLDVTAKMVTLSPGYDERGLLSLAFHPQFKTNGKFYVFYTAIPHSGGPAPGAAWNSLTRISEFKVSAGDPNVADAGSERVILEADHPYLNHNGGTVAFGPDGYLYIGIGDGGNKDDVGFGHFDDWYTANAGGNAQNLWADLMGKVLRIDINNGTPYGIPADNPFATSSNLKKEIYAYGFRNPYRFSFDMGGDHALYLGDAGQSLYEEINLVTKGSNYGWNIKEGKVCFDTDSDLLARPSCPLVDSLGKPLTDPIIQLVNTANPIGGGIATVIVGGNVYRGDSIPQLKGHYVFGIFSQGGSAAAGANAKLYVATAAGSSYTYDALALKDYSSNLGYYLKGFGQDLSGELYITVSGVQGVTGATGKVFKIVPAH